MTARTPKRPWLLPLNPLYRVGLGLRNLGLRSGWEQVHRLRFPVISIGNLSTGGTGKTPLTIALARGLSERGFSVDVLSRGYRRKGSDGALRVALDGTADEFGDEPLLIARQAGVPVYVAASRHEAGVLSEHDSPQVHGPRVHLLDDAFQHRQLHRDVNILLLNRDDWEDRLLPAGNLRETLQAIRRADVIVLPESDAGVEEELRTSGWRGEVWRIHRRMDIPAVNWPVIAFCGIARPEQFFHGLEANGLHVVGRAAFPDHHRYSAADVERLHTKARNSGATALITTEKDEVRLAANPGGSASAPLPVLTAGLRVEIEQERAALDWLAERVIAAAPAESSL